MTQRVEQADISRRRALYGLMASVTAGALPVSSVLAQAGESRRMSSFGADGAALQEAFDWAHASGGTLVLDKEVVVGRTVFMGNLRLVDGGGRIFVRADADYRRPAHEGGRGWAAISMRSAPGNTLYDEPLGTTYLVRIERGCRIDFVRSHRSMPRYPIRFTGLAQGSYLYPAFTGLCLIDDECNGPDWNFFNRCRIGGSYLLQFTRGDPSGGCWIRDMDETGLGPDFYSDFELDNPVFDKIGGRDESASIFTTSLVPGHLRARGSLTIGRSNGLGFSVLNRSKAPPKDFDVALHKVRVRSTVRDDQTVVKIIDDYTRIDDLEATVVGQAKGTYRAAVLQCINDPSSGSVPRIGRARLASEGGGVHGYSEVVAKRGVCSIQRTSISRLRGGAED